MITKKEKGAILANYLHLFAVTASLTSDEAIERAIVEISAMDYDDSLLNGAIGYLSFILQRNREIKALHEPRN